MKLLQRLVFTILAALPEVWAQSSPVITLVANAEGENAVIAANTWVEVKGQNLSKPGDSRIWQGSDFVNGQMPTKLDGVGVTVNGKSAYVYYISPTQVNILTPPDALSGTVMVQVTNNGLSSPAFSVQAKPLSPSFFVFNGGPYVAAQHSADYSLVGPASLYPGSTIPAKAGETVLVYANGFGPTSTPVVSGSGMLTAADSGSPATRIVYQNYPGEAPVISGGMRVQNWTNVTGNTWKTTLPASTQYFENMFYNGARRLRPRLGGSLGTFYRIAKTIYLNAPGPPAAAPNANCAVYIAGSGWECFDRFQYNPADPIANTWKNLAPASRNPCGQPAGNLALTGDIELLVFEQFSTSKLRISCVDAASRIVYLTGPTGFSQNNPGQAGFIAGNRYLVENVQDQLTSAGQWFLDRSTIPWTLTYLANTGENPNADNVIIPQLPQVLVGSNLQYVTFQGLTFEHDNYTVPASGHKSSELEADISAAVSFQNSNHITFDSGTVAQTSGSGLEFIPCINATSPDYCVSNNINVTVANNVVENSAFYDIGVVGIRIGEPFVMADTDANVAQLMTVQNNVVEGYGRIIPASFGIGQGMGHDNLYTHNDVYDGYHCAISTSQSIGDTTKPSGIGNANNTISFNHVYNLLQGIMNDGGSIRIDGGNQVFTAAGNKILNNKIHDVTDSSIQDSNGYGGHGIYMDDNTGLVDVENNLIYRVSGFAVYTPQGPAAINEANTIKNNIFAFARLATIGETSPYVQPNPTSANQSFVVTNNLFYFDRNSASSPPFRVQGGCTYSAFQQFNSNLYWRADSGFASDAQAFHVQPAAGPGPEAPCSDVKTTWTYYTFAQWQQQVGEDAQSVVQNPGFNNPAYPADNYSLPKGSPGVGFVVFDPNQAGRSNPLIHPPAVLATFPTKQFNPATDY